MTLKTNNVTKLPTKAKLIDILLICTDKKSLLETQSLLNHLPTTEIKFRIETTKNLKESIQAMCRHLADLVLLDLHGIKNPDTLVKTISTEFPDTSLIVLIDPGKEEIGKVLINSGAKDYIVKREHSVEETLLKTIRFALERSALYKKLNENQDRKFQNLILQSKEAIFIISDEEKVIFTNDAANQIYHKTRKDIIGYNFHIEIKPFKVKGDETVFPNFDYRLLNHLVSSGKRHEIVQINKSGEYSFLEANANKIDWSGQPSIILRLYDITDNKRISKLTSEIEEKQRLDKLKDEFLSVVSHEMRTPLTIVKGSVSNLLDGVVGDFSTPQRKVLHTTERNVNRLARIINDLLDLSRLESGKATVNRQKLDILDVTKEVVSNFESVAQEKSIKFEIKKMKEAQPVFADPDMVVQIFNNLINNAVRFTDSKITIKISLDKLNKVNNKSQKPDCVKVTIIDNGKGIPKEHVPSLFNKFEQINRPTGGSGYKGTGLGLAICKEIITLHHGDIWANDVDKGASFSFTFPLYHDYDEFLSVLEQSVSQAKSEQVPLSLLVVKIANLSLMNEKSTEKDIAWMCNDLLNEIRHKCLRKPDFIHFRRNTKEFIIILSDTNSNAATNVCRRIQNITKDCFCPSTSGKIFVDLNIGMSEYPDDATQPEDLLEIAFNNKK